MEDGAPSVDVPFGLWELNPAGIVLHYEPEKGGGSRLRPRDVVGRSFLGDVVPAGTFPRLAEMLGQFVAGGAPAGGFDFTFETGPGAYVRARVLLGRLRRQSRPGGETILVHVRSS
jgi:hypothetical protein